MTCVAVGASCLVGHVLRGQTDDGPGAAVQTTWTDGDVDAVAAALDVATCSIQSLAFDTTTNGRVVTTVDVDGRRWTLDLHEHSMRAPGFTVLVSHRAGGRLVAVDPPPSHTYRGVIREMPDAVVAGAFRDGRLTAVIMTATETYAIQPLADAGVLAASAGAHVVYRASDQVNLAGFRCGTTGAGGIAGSPAAGRDVLGRAGIERDAPGSAGTGLKVAELGIDADFEFFQLNQSSVANTVLDIETVMNTVEARYEVTDIGITYEITTVVVRTSSDQPYTSTVADTLLNQLRDTWTSPPESSIPRDTAHLFTGKEIDTNVIGIAFLSTICSSASGYGLSQSRFTTSQTARVALTAHELGHNWSAVHCDADPDCRIMCSAIGACGPITSFGPDATVRIASFKDSRPCLDDLSPPQPPAFADGFTDFSIDPARWSYVAGPLVAEGALNEPSPPFSVLLSRTGSGLYRDHEMRSNFIVMGGLSGVPFSFYTQHRGVDAGGALVVEYWSDSLAWVELDRFVSDGADQSLFEFHEYVLPSDAYHDEFRMRFRTEIDGGNWYVDDVLLGSQVPPVITTDPQNDSVCEGDAAELTVAALGTMPLSYQWRKDGIDIPGANSSSLTIDPADPTDAGSYACVVGNSFGSVQSASAALTVIATGTCDDGDFCNGAETCAEGACQAGGNPCTTPELPFCDPAAGACVACLQNMHCDDGALCNGAEQCVDGSCVAGTDAPPGTPCGDDADTACTAPDSCDGLGHCAANNEPDGTPCDDGAYCNGAETCAGGTCTPGADPCPGQQCVESDQTCIDPAEMSCQVSPSQVPAGGQVTVELFLTNVQELRGYQATVGASLVSGAGTIDVTCPDGVFIDTARPDFVFAGVGGIFPVADCGGRRIATSLTSGTIAVGATPAYMGTFLLDVSADATVGSSFDVSILPPNDSFVLNADAQPLTFEIAPSCTVTVVDCVVVDYGDLAGDQGSCGPNGIVDIFDIFAVLDGFQGVFAEGCTFSDIDIAGEMGGCDSDGRIDIFDIFAVLDAFQGISTCPGPCVAP